MIERARKLLGGRPTGRGIAFLSFTIAAVSELEDRLRREGLVGTPAFPHFIGTFDAFLWQFLIAPFGVDGLERGELDFADARSVALARLRDPACGAILGPAFAARFLELIVDEAQDCNPADLEIIAWFRAAGVPVKVISDPNQAIYGFRGGVTQELGQ